MNTQYEEIFTWHISDKQIESEIWKDIIGYEGLYQVSNMRRVRSLNRIVIDKNERKMLYRGILLTLIGKNKKTIMLCKECRRHVAELESLIATAFPEKKNMFNNER